MIVRANEVAKGYWPLTPGRSYYVVGISDDYYRVISDFNEPILCERAMFDVVNGTIPDDWIWERYSNDEYYADPPGLNAPGFYEDFFDRKEYAIKRFNDYLKTVGISVEARPLDALPAALAGDAEARILTTKKLLVPFDTAKKAPISDDLLFPTNVGAGPFLCGVKSGTTADCGIVVDIGVEITEVEILDKAIMSEHQALSNYSMPAMLGKYIEQLQAFQIGNIVLLQGTSAEDVKLEEIAQTPSSFRKRYNVCRCCGK